MRVDSGVMPSGMTEKAITGLSQVFRHSRRISAPIANWRVILSGIPTPIVELLLLDPGAAGRRGPRHNLILQKPRQLPA